MIPALSVWAPISGLKMEREHQASTSAAISEATDRTFVLHPLFVGGGAGGNQVHALTNALHGRAEMRK
jgi:hypothetical protein